MGYLGFLLETKNSKCYSLASSQSLLKFMALENNIMSPVSNSGMIFLFQCKMTQESSHYLSSLWSTFDVKFCLKAPEQSSTFSILTVGWKCKNTYFYWTTKIRLLICPALFNLFPNMNNVKNASPMNLANEK